MQVLDTRSRRDASSHLGNIRPIFKVICFTFPAHFRPVQAVRARAAGLAFARTFHCHGANAASVLLFSAGPRGLPAWGARSVGGRPKAG
jgi:hypothetical protein